MGLARATASSTRYETQGLAAGAGATVTPGATANSKGSYVALGTTGFEYDGLFVAITGLPGGGGTRYRIDISSNTGGSDQVIIGDLYFDPSPAAVYTADYKHLLVPVKVASAAVLKARCSSASGGGSISVSTLGFCGDARQMGGFRALLPATDFSGADPVNLVSLSGTSLTGWTQIMASTPVRFAGLYLTVDSLGNTGLTTANAMFELGKGPSGSEQTLGIKVAKILNSAENGCGGVAGPFPCDVPAGSRLVVRGQCNTADNDAIGIVLHGLVA